MTKESRGGELSLSACPGVGNRPPRNEKKANPGGHARGGMVTGGIEPCIIITRNQNWKKTSLCNYIFSLNCCKKDNFCVG